MTSRLTIILHPNTERACIVVSDKRFNDEQYNFSRKKEAVGHEERMLKRANKVIGVSSAKASKSELTLDLESCTLPSDWVPSIVEIVREYCGPDWNPTVFLDDRRWKVKPLYNKQGYTEVAGIRFKKGSAMIGVEYTPWED